MKKTGILLLFAIVFLAGCEDFLDTKSLTTKASDNYPSTMQEANEMLTGVYAEMTFQDPEMSSQFFMALLAGDEGLGGNLSGSNNCAMNFMMYTNIDNFYGAYDGDYWNPGVWSRDYTLIYRANTALAAFDRFEGWTSAAEKNRYFGEIYFLRAYAYNELTQVFGKVPLRLGTDMTYLESASIDEIYEQIGSDLKNAIDLMPAKSYLGNDPMAGHATKYAAEAMMARVFLFYTGRYAKTELPGGITKDQVKAWIDDCVKNSGHDLVSDQRNLWAYTNDVTNYQSGANQYKYAVNNSLHWEGLNAIETVYANKTKLKGNTWSNTMFSNTCITYFSPSHDDSPYAERYPFGQGWGAGPVSPALVDDWKAWSAQQVYTDGYTEDPRLTGSIWSYDAINPNTGEKIFTDRKLNPDEPDYTVSKRYYEQTGYHQKKYIAINSFGKVNPEKEDEAPAYIPFGVQMYPGMITSASQTIQQIPDLILIRFADVLLMHSELWENAEGLNRVRARSHLAPVAYSLEAIKNERRYELAFEAVRWFDLLRWSGPSLEEAGEALNKQNGFTLVNAAQVVPMVQYDYKARLKVTQGYWYIPQTEIERSRGGLEQNPGWGAEAMFKDWNNM
ncbi:MAG: RagB/SusD family nutrient uptake outer membrane protein [Dysgonamonadaceae bacterium]|jgi:hypothetical protein|nr:RagB/SusD family nutrient uptake outer membrane protein [Dysgonamonadaceae bacterium]